MRGVRHRQEHFFCQDFFVLVFFGCCFVVFLVGWRCDFEALDGYYSSNSFSVEAFDYGCVIVSFYCAHFPRSRQQHVLVRWRYKRHKHFLGDFALVVFFNAKGVDFNLKGVVLRPVYGERVVFGCTRCFYFTAASCANHCAVLPFGFAFFFHRFLVQLKPS